MAAHSGEVALVTGASRGIGYNSALTLARNGAHVIAVARTVGGLEELDDEIQSAGSSATLVPLDLLDGDAIDRLGASIHERWGELDILVGNAGMLGGLSPVDHFDPKTFDKVFALNVTANWRLIRSLAPLLTASKSGRAIFMCSGNPENHKPFWGLYSATQSALQTLVRTWAAETEKSPLRVNLLDPGPMRTALRAAAMPGEDQAKLAHPSEIEEALLKLCSAELSQTGQTFSRKINGFQP